MKKASQLWRVRSDCPYYGSIGRKCENTSCIEQRRKRDEDKKTADLMKKCMREGCA
jgi:hypothetical protein